MRRVRITGDDYGRIGGDDADDAFKGPLAVALHTDHAAVQIQHGYRNRASRVNAYNYSAPTLRMLYAKKE